MLLAIKNLVTKTSRKYMFFFEWYIHEQLQNMGQIIAMELPIMNNYESIYMEIKQVKKLFTKR